MNISLIRGCHIDFFFRFLFWFVLIGSVTSIYRIIFWLKDGVWIELSLSRFHPLQFFYDDDRLNNSLSPRVVSFKMRVGGKYIGQSNSNRLSSKMKAAIKKAKKGEL